MQLYLFIIYFIYLFIYLGWGGMSNDGAIWMGLMLLVNIDSSS